MNNNIIADLRSSLGSMTKLQRKVADYILNDPLEAAFSTIDKIAHLTGVSTATVVRLTSTLGYEGFAAFQEDLRSYMRAQSAPLDKLAINSAETDFVTTGNSHCMNLTSALVANLHRTCANVTDDLITSIASAIIGARHIYVAGYRSSRSFAAYLSYNLDRMFANTDMLSDAAVHLPENMRRLGKGDVVIVSSLARYFYLSTEVAKYAHQNGCTVIVVTDSHSSPMSQYADIQLVGHCSTKDFHNSQLTMIYLADLIIDMCSRMATSVVKENLKNSERYIKELGFMVND